MPPNSPAPVPPTSERSISGGSSPPSPASQRRSKLNRHPSDPVPATTAANAGRVPKNKTGGRPARASIHRYGTTMLPPTLAPPLALARAAALLSIRLSACVAMSSLSGGLANRASYAPSRLALLRDVLSVVLENNLMLTALERGLGGGGATMNPTKCSSTCQVQRWRRRLKQLQSSLHAQPGSSSSSSNGFGARSRTRRLHCACRCATLRTLYRRTFALVLSVTYVMATWGDYVFQTETRGTLPTMWVIAPGLKDPKVHAAAQLRAHGDVFWGGLVRSISALLAGMAFVCIVEGTSGSGSGVRLKSQGDPHPGQRRSSHLGTAKNFDAHGLPHNFDGLSDLFLRPRVVAINLALLLFMHAYGAWAPLTNLVYCAIGIFVLTPPGGSVGRRGSGAGVNPARAATLKKWAEATSAGRRPNVVLVVHESLSGAAMETTRGKESAPFYHGPMRSNPDVYQFRNARTVAGTTPIATPGLLAGLIPYTDRGVDILKRASLATDLKSVGYDTASFVSYGADWTGNAWAIVSDLVMPGFDAIFDPQATGDPLVNEYGMDDRVLISRHFRRWVRSMGRRRQGGVNVTSATGTNSSEESSNVGGGRVFATESSQGMNGTSNGGVGTSRKNQRGGGGDNSDNKPFFAVLVLNNQHFPHLRHENYTGDPDCERRTSEENGGEKNGASISLDERHHVHSPDSNEEGNGWDQEDEEAYLYDDRFAFEPSCGLDAVSNYYSSIRTTDEALRGLFEVLAEEGLLDDTVVMGAGDHGETPGLMKRLDDVDAPILDVPLWMHIPRGLLPPRAYHEESQADGAAEIDEKYDGRGRRGTYLRDNIDRGVSILDVVPTLRDVLGMEELYTPEERDFCIVGMSLLGRHVEENRLMASWQGLPLQGHQMGIFSSSKEALVYYKKDPSKSKVIEFKFEDRDPFFALSERSLDEMEKTNAHRWKGILEGEGFFEHDLVKTQMPGLKKIFDTGSFLRSMIT